ncbi:MAG: microcystin degradation protein MlrC [Granulosicoccus sp.]|jgi:microcystin degradation protein MlrC
MAENPRIAILGFSLESNRNSPVSDRLIFEQTLYLAEDEITRELAGDRAMLPGTVRGFCAAMDEHGDWEAVPIVLAEAPPGGPADHGFFTDMLKQMRAGLQTHTELYGKLDGVYISEHGAGLSTENDDADGAVFAMVRETVGPEVPVVATLDLHGHVTTAMMSAADVMVAYITNPHVDQVERGREAAAIMLEMQCGMKTCSALVKVPMISPAVSLLTSTGPYADLINYGQSCLSDVVLNVSILAGFAPANASTNGMSVVVTTRNDQQKAQSLANDLATRAWSERHRYIAKLTPISEAVKKAEVVLSNATLPSILLADVADNPGGGGRGNTTYLLRAIHEQQLQGVVLGMMFDPALAAEAQVAGQGARMKALFNQRESNQFSEPYEAEVVIEKLLNELCVGRRGIYEGRRIDLGQCALLNLDGIRILVVSRRHQCADPIFLERMGVDLANVRVLVIKSRGHFRAGFDEHFQSEQIIEVDAPGLTTPDLVKLDLNRVPRPVFPLDRDMEWVPD